MSDPYNVNTAEDPQSKSVLTLAQEQKELRKSSFQKDKKEAPQR
jgi:hypothetical protein